MKKHGGCGLKEIIFKDDKYAMNWLRPEYEYAHVTGPMELTYQVENRQAGDIFYTDIFITNNSEKPYFTNRESIGIAVPLADMYEDSGTCLTNRCHTHIFCGGDIAYIVALRMGGEPPHLGLICTEGRIGAYSIVRDVEKQSNDRGCFYLNPEPMQFQANETKRISWVIFPHQGKEDFFKKACTYRPFVKVTASRYVLFPNEVSEIDIAPSFTASSVKVDGEELHMVNGKYTYFFKAEQLGEKILKIEVDGIRTSCALLVQESFQKLVKRRCEFIVRNQQFHGAIQELDNAYLIYDNAEQIPVYSKENDHNACRERIGMGVLIARYLQGNTMVPLLEQSLREYTGFVLQQVIEADMGKVCNDIQRDDSFVRLYNYPWYALFFIELYRLYKEPEYILLAARIIDRFYQIGGLSFYPIELPILLLVEGLKDAGCHEEKKAVTAWFIKHADQIAAKGTDYPKHEVNYEQSIVAPAADILLQVYNLTKEKKYLEAAKIQIQVLELFNGFQPDYHLHEVAIRHWDGFWFGKRRQYGDTFPHYWSALTGNVFHLYAKAIQDKEYDRRAEDSLRGVLPLFFPDGSASCAYLYPLFVNHVPGKYYDEYANDQDWGLYYYLRGHFDRE